MSKLTQQTSRKQTEEVRAGDRDSSLSLHGFIGGGGTLRNNRSCGRTKIALASVHRPPPSVQLREDTIFLPLRLHERTAVHDAPDAISDELRALRICS